MPRAPPIKPYGPENSERLQQYYRFHGYIEGAEHRGMKLSQLQRVIQWCETQSYTWREQMLRGVLPAPSKEVMNFHHVSKWLIGPATFEKGCAFLEMLTDLPQTPIWFVSYVWNGSICEFLQCVETHYRTRDIGIFFEDSPYWVCAFAIRMHGHEQDFRSNPEKSGFYQAVQFAKGILLVLGESDSTNAFLRTWCSFELSLASHRAQKHGQFLLLDIAICQNSKTQLLTTGMTDREMELEEQNASHGVWAKECREKAFPLEVLCNGLAFELEKTQTTTIEEDPELLLEVDSNAEEQTESNDRDKGGDKSKNNEGTHMKFETTDYRSEILNYVADRFDKKGMISGDPAFSQHENYIVFNRRLRAEIALAAWRKALLQGPGVVEDLGLPAVLRADATRTAIVWNFFGFEELGDAGLVCLAQGLPASLSKMELSFCRCGYIGDRGISALGAALPLEIRVLLLDFSYCGQIGDVGLEQLARNLPRSLESLRLRFKGVKGQITDRGVEALSRNLPTSLNTLELDFATCEKIGHKGIEYLSEKMPPLLRTLHLDFWMCGAISNDGGIHGEKGGVQMLADALSETLETLILRFTGIRGNFNDKGVQCLAKKLPEGLKVLKLDLLYLDGLGDAGLEGLGQDLPSTLQTFELKVEGCDKITDAGITFLCDKMISMELHTLLLQVEFCSQITNKGVNDLAERLPTTLRSLSLNFGSCRQITDDGVIALAHKLPSSLQKLHLDVKYCKKVGDMGVTALGRNLPTSLVELSLHFGDCELIYDAGIVALAKGLPQTIEWLEINMWRCKNVGDTGVMYIAKVLPASCKVLLLTIDGTKVSPEKRAYCSGIEAMRQCKPTATDLLAPMSQPDRRCYRAQSQIAFLRRHGPNLVGVEEALSKALPVLEPVSSSLLDKLNSQLLPTRNFSKSSSPSKSSALSKSQSMPALHRKKPPVAAQMSLSKTFSLP